MTLNLIFEIIKVVAVVIASFVAIFGITSWRREAKWKRKYELAEEVLSLFYEVRERIESIRSPFSNTQEGKTRKRAANENGEVAEILDNAYVVFERYEKEKEAFIKLKSLKYRFMALYGNKAGEPFDDINKVMKNIFIAAHKLGTRYWKDQGRRNFTDEQFEKHLEEMHKNEAIFWAGMDEVDEIKEEVDSIIEEVEKMCKSIIEKR